MQVTVHSPINENWTALIKRQMFFPSHKSNSLVSISKSRTLPISGRKSIPELVEKNQLTNNKWQQITRSQKRS